MGKKNKNNNKNEIVIEASSINIKINSDSSSLKTFSKSEIFKIYLQKVLSGNIYYFDKAFSIEIFKEKTIIKITNYSLKEETDKIIKLAITDTTIINLSISEKEEEEKIEEFFIESAELKLLTHLIIHNLLSKTDPIFPLKGVILKGSPGTGKSTLINKIRSNFNDKLKIYFYDQNEFTKNIILTEKNLSSRPFLVIIDELKKDEENEKLKNLFKSMRNFKGMIIGCIKSDISESFDNIRSSDMFEKDIEISLPDTLKRKNYINYYFDILQKKFDKKNNGEHKQDNIENLKELKNEMENLKLNKLNFDENFYEALSLKCPGFTYLDLKNLIREIEILYDKEKNFNNNLITKAFDNIIPQNLRNQSTKFNKTKYSEIGGYEEVKRQLKTVIELPLKNPEIFLKKGITPSKGILLYGPPGCSKTMFARALATESNLNFISIKGPEIFNKYVGDSEKRIRDIFKKARFCAPTIIFFDEIDALASKREEKTGVSDRILTQLLTEIDGVDIINKIDKKYNKKDIFSNNMVVIVGATNRPDILDPAILRPGRFDQLIFIDLPDFEARKQILNLQGEKMKIEEGFDIDHFANVLKGYSGAEVIQVCKEAAMRSIYDGDIEDEVVYIKDFEYAIEKVKPRIKKEVIQKFKNFHNNN